MEERKFTWFPKLTRALEATPSEFKEEYMMAILHYGTYGIEPEFSQPLLAVAFEGIREDIDNSVNARANNKGGRPKKRENEEKNGGYEVNETPETPVSQNENLPKPPFQEFSEPETPVSQNEKPQNPPYIYQTIPNQNIPVKEDTPIGVSKKSSRFSPPTAEEVQAYANSRGTPIDAQRFVDFYASKGWKVGTSPMKDWKAAVRNWTARDNHAHKSKTDKETKLDEAFTKYDELDKQNGYTYDADTGILTPNT